MPTYTYMHASREPRQPPCQMQEVEQKITDAALAVCPTCGGRLWRVIPSGTSFRFKRGAPTPRFGR